MRTFTATATKADNSPDWRVAVETTDAQVPRRVFLARDFASPRYAIAAVMQKIIASPPETQAHTIAAAIGDVIQIDVCDCCGQEKP